jgi:hypothetical protein
MSKPGEDLAKKGSKQPYFFSATLKMEWKYLSEKVSFQQTIRRYPEDKSITRSVRTLDLALSLLSSVNNFRI